jgi:hypothetical protein
MKASFPDRRALCLLILVSSIAVAPACAAETKTGRGGKAGKAPGEVNAFVALEKRDGSAAIQDGVELAVREMHLPQAAGLSGWTDFSLAASGKAKLESDNRFGFEVVSQGDAEADGSLRAFRLRLSGVSASGGTLYTVSFAASDLVSGSGGMLQPAVFAAAQAASASGKKEGQVRVLAAKYGKGRFTYKLAIK